MPFDVLPQEVQTETKFQKFADAMLKGCAITVPIRGLLLDGHGGACAVGALLVGLGADPFKLAIISHPLVDQSTDVRIAYRKKYMSSIETDNDHHHLSREQIAARIAAL